jgi:hypothetical protein
MDIDVVNVGTWVAFVLTLMVYCYLGKDIPIFHAIYRVAVYVFIGVALAYGALIAWHEVLVPRLFRQLGQGQWFYFVPLLLCLFLLSRAKRSWRGVSSLTIAFLFGVGAALAAGGALVGTLVPQVQATFLSVSPAHYEATAMREGALPASYALDALLVVIGTITTLLYFYFTVGRGSQRLERARGWVMDLAAGFGKVFVMFTFGALFSAAAISRIALLVDRIRFIIETVLPYIPSL